MKPVIDIFHKEVQKNDLLFIVVSNKLIPVIVRKFTPNGTMHYYTLCDGGASVALYDSGVRIRYTDFRGKSVLNVPSCEYMADPCPERIIKSDKSQLNNLQLGFYNEITLLLNGKI